MPLLERFSSARAIAAFALVVLLTLSTSAPTAVAAYGDEYWWDGFALPDVDGWVNCVTEYQGSLVIGGRFSLAGGVPVQNIARWDGSSWSPLVVGLDGEVLSLAVFGDELIAGGRFDHSGTTTLRGIARWNGEAWSPLGAGLWLENLTFSPGAKALAAQGGTLYAAGDFDHAGAVLARSVARWNGSEWSALGEGLDGGAQSVLPLGDSLVVGGSFHAAGGVPASGVALWDGQTWSPLGSGVSYAYGGPYVFDMVRYRGALVVAGLFDSAGSQPASNVAEWNGQLWQPFSDSSNNGISEAANALEVIGDTLLVAGVGLHSWNGVTWTTPEPYAAGLVSTLSSTHWGLAAGGRFIGFGPAGEFAAANIGFVRGATWADPSSGNHWMRGLGGFGSPNVTALISCGGALVAAGRFSYAGGPTGRTSLGPIARWDGESWSTLGVPPNGPTQSFLARGDTLYAAGTFASYPYPSTTPVMMYDGANWTALDTLSLWATSLAVYQGALYAGGRRRLLSDHDAGGVYRWSGSRWQSLGALSGGDGFPSVDALIESGGRLVAAGTFDSIAGTPAQGIAAWDGVSWVAMDSGLQMARATSLAECEGVLYAGGEFYDQAYGQSSIVRWDGTRWRQVPVTNARIDPTTLLCVNGRLIAGGYVVGPPGVVGVASWDGSSWSFLGSGTNGRVSAMAVDDGALYVGGSFSQAGSRSSSAIARWDLAAEHRTSAMLVAETGIPNPFRFSTSIAYRLTTAGHVRVSVYDLRGRRITVLEDASRAAGTHFVIWDGHTDGGDLAPSGVYFLRLELPGRSETRRVVRLR